jgi:hypothetical protein
VEKAEIKKLVDSQPEEFELMLLCSLDKFPAHMAKVHGSLCRDPEGNFVRDFDDYRNNALYRVLDSYHALMSKQSDNYPRLSEQMAGVYLVTHARDGRMGVAMEDVQEVLKRLREVRMMNPAHCFMLSREGYSYWIRKQRMYSILKSGTASKSWDPDELMGQVSEQLSGVGGSQERTLFELSETLSSRPEEVDRISTGMAALDASLAGGLGKKEYVLFIAPQGAGKTVLACQLATTMSLQGDVGLLVTTEQPDVELAPRMVSNNCNIPFGRFTKQGFHAEHGWTQDEVHRYREWVKEIRGRLYIKNWDKAKSVTANLEEVIREVLKVAGKLDYLVLDWIGGAMGVISANDSSAIRHHYQFTSDAMADIADDHNLRAVAFAQAHPVRALNKKKVDASCIAECASMGRNATAVFGITALLDQMADDESDVVYSKNQFFYCSKGRKAENKHVRVQRDFGYQRFKSL